MVQHKCDPWVNWYDGSGGECLVFRLAVNFPFLGASLVV